VGAKSGVAVARTPAASTYAVAERAGDAHSSGMLGLSGSDVLDIVLALAALALTTAATMRVAATGAPGRHRG
jgi:hypothetical protein